MGNSSSTTSNKSVDKNFENFYEIIDYIATYYILTMDFKSLSKLSEKEYCDNLVVLTSDIIQKYFNDVEVTYLAQRIKDGLEINDLKKENLMFITKDQLTGLDVQNDAQKSIRKKRICIGIAKFYIKIAHIFAAIVMTINPVYIYKDENGNTVENGLLEKNKIPKNVNRKIVKLNICDNRIRALKKGELSGDDNSAKSDINLEPMICDINLNKDKGIKSLSDEPGITELMDLYLDDKYDYSTGQFIGMSDSTKNQFKKDLQIFYTAFTGNETMPPSIEKFSDIKLRDFNNEKGCQASNPFLKGKYNINKKDKLFTDYAENIKNMIQNASDNQSKLLSIINELFIYVDDPYSNKKKIRVNPKLNEESLQKIVEKTRNIIIKLYVNCESDYLNGIKIFEAIVESKILETTQKQIESLKNQANQLVDETKNITKPDKTEPYVEPNNVVITPSIDSNIPYSTPSINQNPNFSEKKI